MKKEFIVSWVDADGHGQSVFVAKTALQAANMFMRTYRFRRFLDCYPL